MKKLLIFMMLGFGLNLCGARDRLTRVYTVTVQNNTGHTVDVNMKQYRRSRLAGYHTTSPENDSGLVLVQPGKKASFLVDEQTAYCRFFGALKNADDTSESAVSFVDAEGENKFYVEKDMIVSMSTVAWRATGWCFSQKFKPKHVGCSSSL